LEYFTILATNQALQKTPVLRLRLVKDK